MICTSNQDEVVGTTSPPASPETTIKKDKIHDAMVFRHRT